VLCVLLPIYLAITEQMKGYALKLLILEKILVTRKAGKKDYNKEGRGRHHITHYPTF